MKSNQEYCDRLAKYDEHTKTFGTHFDLNTKVRNLEDVTNKQYKYISIKDITLSKTQEALTEKDDALKEAHRALNSKYTSLCEVGEALAKKEITLTQD